MAGVVLILAATAAGIVLVLLVVVAVSIRHEDHAPELGCPADRNDARVRQLTGLYVRRSTACTNTALCPQPHAADARQPAVIHGTTGEFVR